MGTRITFSRRDGNEAAGYLASVHMVQFLLVALIAPPLLLYSIPVGAWQRLASHRRLVRVLRTATRPLVASVVFNVLVWLTHWPRIVDGLMGYQAGSFLIDMLWIAAGLVCQLIPCAPRPAATRSASTDAKEVFDGK